MNWWKTEKLYKYFEDTNFLKIIDFYLFNCKVYHKRKMNNEMFIDKVSQRANTFFDLNVSNNKFKRLLWKMKKTCNSLIYKSIKSTEDFEEVFNSLVNEDELNKGSEIIVYKNDSNMNKTMQLYYIIRCSLAHGSFCIKEEKEKNKIIKFYYFENKNKDKIKARFKIKEKTLLKWIELCKDYES